MGVLQLFDADETTFLCDFAGLAAAYILRDQYDTGLESNPIGIPGGAYEVPLVIQDRLFKPEGRSCIRRAASLAPHGSASTSATRCS